ncbi:MAG: glycosyl hydrolase-related protein [bacterium]
MNSMEEIRKALKDTKIFIIPYAHCDWAWTHTRKWHRERYASIINSILEILENYPQFRWYMDNYKMELTPFLEKYPGKIERLKEFVKEGKIGVCGGYANVRPNMVGEETFIRNLVIGRKYFKNLFPDADLSVHADAVDVALGHPQMPQILRKAGYKYFRCWRPHEVMTVKGIPNEFIWKGLDGSEILVSRGSYAGLGQKELAELDYKKDWEKTLYTLYELELEYILSTSKTKLLWVSHGMDDMLPLRTYPGQDELPIDLIGIVEEWNRQEKTPMIFATPLEFYKALENIREALPTIEGTIDPCDVCYNAAWNGEKGLWALRYKGDCALVEAEKWNTISSMFTRDNTNYQSLWEDLLTSSAHATQWLFEEDFQEIYSLASRVVSEGVYSRNKALRDIMFHIDIPENCSAVIFNSLSFKYDPLVKITLPVSNIDKVQLKDGNNNIIPFQVLKNYIWPEKVWEWDVLARIDLPSLGYNIIKIEESEKSHILKGSPRLDIKLEAGRVVEIIDNKTKNTYKASGNTPWNHLRYYGVDTEGGVLHVGPITGCCDVQWHKYEVIEEGPLRWAYRLWGNIGGHNVVQDIMLFDKEDRIEFLTEVDWKGGNGFLLAMIPLDSQGELLGDIPFGIERKPIESEPYGKLPGKGWDNIHRQREGMFFAKSFVIHKGKNYSTVFWNINGDRYFIYDKKLNTLGHILINSIVRPQGTWEEHVNSFIEGIGRHLFSYSIKVSRDEIDESETVKTSLKLKNNPVVLDPQRGLDKALPPYYSFLSLIPEDIVVSAIYREGEDIIIRLFEPVGKKREVRLHTYFNFKEVFPEDFIGNHLEEPSIRLKDKEISFEIKPYEIVTLRGRLR